MVPAVSSKKSNHNSSSSAPRTSIACERCRKRHIKCDGGNICSNCVKSKAQCIYVEGDKKIVISLRFLQKLKRENERLKKLLLHYKSLSSSNGNNFHSIGGPIDDDDVVIDEDGDLDMDLELRTICEENKCDLDDESPPPNTNITTTTASPSVASSVHRKSPSTIKQEDSSTSVSVDSMSDQPTSVTLPTELGCVVIPLMPSAGSVDSNVGSFQGSSSMSMFGLEIKGILPCQAEECELDLHELSPSKAFRQKLLAARLRRNGYDFHLEIFQDCRDHPFEINFELPTYERATLAYNEFNTYLCGCFYFFNATEFKKKLKDTYDNMKTGPLNLYDLLWIARLLLVLALGELYILGSHKGQKGSAPTMKSEPIISTSETAKSKSETKSGSEQHNSFYDDECYSTIKGFAEILFFKKAACLTRILLDEIHNAPSVEAVEVLLLTSFFHQIMDWQAGSYIVNGLALRTSLLLGLHVDVGKGSFSVHELEHRRRIWWSVFHFDRYIAAKAGLPLTIYESSILTKFPRDIEGTDGVRGEFPPADYINSFIEVTKVVSFALTQLYQRQPETSNGGGNILPAIYEVMNKLFEWKGKWTAKLGINWSPTSEEFAISRTAANVYHEYFHCVNLTVRPLLYHFVRKRILDRHSNPGPIDLSGYSQNIITLLNASMSASLQTIQSMHYLLTVDQFATFGYLDREYTFSSASTLELFIVAFGVSQICSPLIGKALQLLHHSEVAGNGHSSIRKRQLLNLVSSFQFLDNANVKVEADTSTGRTEKGYDNSTSTTNPGVHNDNNNNNGSNVYAPVVNNTGNVNSNTAAAVGTNHRMAAPTIPSRTGRIPSTQSAVPQGSQGVQYQPTTDLHQLSNISLDDFGADNINFGLDVEKDLWEEISTEASWLGNVSDEFRSLIQDSMFSNNNTANNIANNTANNNIN